MTDLLRRPGPGRAGSAARPAAPSAPSGPHEPSTGDRGAVAVGATAVLAVHLVGLVVCLGLATATWLAADAPGDAGGALLVGAAAWAVGLGSSVVVVGTTVSLVPLGALLGLGAGVAVLVRRRLGPTARGAGRRTVGVTTVAALVLHVLVLLTVHLVVASGGVELGLLRGLVVSSAVVGLGAAVGAALAAGVVTDALATCPAGVRAGVRSAGWAATVLLGSSTLLLLYALLAHASTVGRLGGSLSPGVVGGTVLVVASLAVAPNAVLLSSAFLLGPGFAVGTGTSVSLVGVRLGDLPAFPLLGALPTSGDQPVWVVGLAAVPVLAGAVGGWRAVRSARDDLPATLADAVVPAALGAAAAGLALGLATAVAGGAVGPGRMADVGAVVWCVPVAVVALLVGGAVGAVAGHYRERRS